MVDGDFAGTERFEVRKELGVGGFGRVYLAWDRDHAQLVALKLLHRGDPRALRRFKGEFRTLANLAHPNLVSLYELHQAGDAWFFTMEYVEGAPFTDWLRPGTGSSHPSSLMTRPARPSARGAASEPMLAQTWGPTGEVARSTEAVSAKLTEAASTLSVAVGAGAELVGSPARPLSDGDLPTPAADDPEVALAAQVAGLTVFKVGRSTQQTPLALPQPFFGIEAPDAETLRAWEATLPLAAAPRAIEAEPLRRAFFQLVEALAWLHTSGHLHRDIKPSNVLVDASGVVKVLDFGLVTRLFAPSGELGDVIIGTPAFIAPELCAGLPPSPASDWYSVGVMLYLALTGTLPFSGDLSTLVLAKQALAPRPPSELAPVPRDLERLCLALLSRNPVDRPDASSLFAAFADSRGTHRVTTGAWTRATPLSFVGRRAEVSALARLGQRRGVDSQAAADIALVEGPSGYGKTALVEHVLRELQHASPAPLILRSRCFERGSVRFRALDGAIDDLAQHLSQLGDAAQSELLPQDVRGRAALARLFPALSQSEAGEVGGEAEAVDSQDSRRRAFAALREVLTRVARDREVIVSIDDAHWADEDSVGLLAELVRGTPVRWILAFRSEERHTSPFLQAFLRGVLPTLPASRVSSIALGPLEPDEARALANARLDDVRVGNATSGDALTAAELGLEPVLTEAAGHPLFIAELALLHGRGLDESVLGRGLEGLLAMRVAGLPPSARALLELVAVAGEPIAVRLVRVATGADQRDLTLLVQDHLVSARPSASGELVMCWHDRVRETVVKSLDPLTRARRHEALAEGAERLGIGDALFRFEHWRLARPVIDAPATRARIASLGLEAALAASSAFAFDQAARLYEQVIALEPPTTPDLYERLGQSLVDAGRGALAARAFLEASRRALSGTEVRRLELRAAEQYLFAGAFGEGEAVIRKVLGRVGLSVAQGVPGAMASFALESLRMRLRGMEFEPRPEASVPQDALALVDTLWSGTIGLSMAKPIASQAFQQRHLRAALDAGEPLRVARALSIELAFSGLPGGNDGSKSRALSERGHAVARTLAHPYADAFITMSDGGTHWLCGRWRAAQEAVESSLEVFRRECRGVTWEKDTAQFVALSCLAHRGELAELRRRLDEALADAMERGDLYIEVQLRTRFSPLVELMDDRPEAARDAVTGALARWTAEGYQIVHFWSYLNRVQALLYAGQARLAWDELVAGEKPLGRSMMLMGQYYRVQFHDLVAKTALAAAATGFEPKALRARAEASTRRLAREAMAWSLPKAALYRGLMAGRGRAARSELLHAASGFRAADMLLHAWAAELALARHDDDARREAAVLGRLTALGVSAPARFCRVISGA